MENMREYWAREAEMMRDKSAVLGSKAQVLATPDAYEDDTSSDDDDDGTYNFEPNKVVMWLKSAVGNLPAGLKVIALDTNKRSKTRCIYWWSGKYNQAKFDSSNLINFRLITDDSGIAFRNDIEHLLNRVHLDVNKQQEFKQLVDRIAHFVKTYDKQQMVNAAIVLGQSLHVNMNDKVKTLETFKALITMVYDPIDEGMKYADRVIFLPLSLSWFSSHPILQARYDNYWLKTELQYLLRGGLGEIVEKETDEFKLLTDELLYLKNLLIENNMLNSPESKWLNTLNNESFKKINKFIAIHDKTWAYNEHERYASLVAIENSFGPFKIPALLSVMIHELTQGGYSKVYLPFLEGLYADSNKASDGHIESDKTKFTWEQFCTKKWSIKTIKNEKKSIFYMDHLYQSHKLYSALALAIILEKIKNVIL